MARDNKANKMLRYGMLLSFLVCLGVGGFYAYPIYQLWKNKEANNMAIGANEEASLFIPTGSEAQDVAEILKNNGTIKDRDAFLNIANAKNYGGKNIVPGFYRLKGSFTNDELINHLRAGNGRLEVSVTFNNLKTLDEFAEKASKNIELSKETILKHITDSETMAKYGMKKETMITMFIPNTYKMNWAISLEDFMKRMSSEYKRFWNADRKALAKKINLKQSEVATLASIVMAEQGKKPDEWPRLAGAYVNRIKKGMKLQADPTVKFAVGDWSIKRVLYKHLEVDSPYNTYKYKGLPPGPILMASSKAMDAVLHYENHKYIYFCAEPGYDGYHAFATNLSEHNRNAKKFHNWLNKEKIK